MIYGSELFSQLNRAPQLTSRGLLTKELINAHYTVSNGAELHTHKRRKLSLSYIKHELLWYINGNRYDTSIKDYAKIWADCIDSGGGINSNYGQYLFPRPEETSPLVLGNSLAGVIWDLHRDIHSRRAVVTILGRLDSHYDVGGETVSDVPCTTSLQFLVRDGGVFVIATMRSQDAIFGSGNDIPAFMFFGSIVAKSLGMELRALHMNVGSLHVYARHFEMAKHMAVELDGWGIVGKLPELNLDDVEAILDHGPIPENSALRAWLSDVHL